jgi:ADP-ribosylglycohydrolase
VTTQLACFTVEGLIRTWVRAQHRGIGPATEPVVRNAYRRWATIQGIDLGRDGQELDGWLHQVPALAERRGDAPAVVSALRAPQGGAPAPAPATSRGHHAVTRLLPAAAAPWCDDVRGLASATHGSAMAVEAAALAVDLVRVALNARTTDEWTSLAARSPLLAGALDSDVPLAELGRSHSARSAVRGGVAVAARCADGSPTAVGAALHTSRHAAVPAAVGPVAGALLGAQHGVESLPTDLVSRLELAWVVDTLARDLVSQELDRPGGSEYAAAPDPHWWDRYPGW